MWILGLGGVAVVTVSAVNQATLQPGLYGRHQLDGGAELQPQHARQLGLRQLRQAGTVYQVVQENLQESKNY